MNILTRINGHICGNVLKIRLKPRTIQLPITSYCNSQCKTCNIWKEKNHQNINAEDLCKALQDPFFSKVESVGINGGEPSLHSQFYDVIDAVLTLNNLKSIYFISNGLSQKNLLSKLEKTKEKCNRKGVKFHLTISLDGVGEIHNQTRGVKDGYSRTLKTIESVAEQKNKYCDSFDVGYTVSRYNYMDMVAVEALLTMKNIDSYYHIAVPNKRIHTFNDSGYDILNDKRATYLAREFFFSKYIDAKSLKSKIKHYINFYYLKENDHRRIAMCNYLKRDVTIDEKLNLYLCATASDCVGSLRKFDISDLKKKGCLEKEYLNVKEYCSSCIHYAFAPTIKGMMFFCNECTAKRNLIIDLVCAKLHI